MVLENKKTKREIDLEERMKDEHFVIAVLNFEKSPDGSAMVVSKFTEEELEGALHKIKLDILTNAHLCLEQPIKVFVKRTKDKLPKYTAPSYVAYKDKKKKVELITR